MQTTVDLVSTDNVFHNTMEMRIKLEFSRGEHVFLRDLRLRQPRAHAPCCGRGSAGTVGARGWGSVSLGGPFLLGTPLLTDFSLLNRPEMGRARQEGRAGWPQDQWSRGCPPARLRGGRHPPEVLGTGADPRPVFPWERRGSCALGGSRYQRRGNAGPGHRVGAGSPARPQREEVAAARLPCPGVTLSRSMWEGPWLYFRAGSCPAWGCPLGAPRGQPRCQPGRPLSHGSDRRLIRAAPVASAPRLPPSPPHRTPNPAGGKRRDPGTTGDTPGTRRCPSQAKAMMRMGRSPQPRGAEASPGNRQFGTHGGVITISGRGVVPVRLSACPLPAGWLPPSTGGLMGLRARR